MLALPGWKVLMTIHSCALMELSWQGSAYTWFNKRFSDQTIQQRLDHALVSIEWQECFSRAQVIHESLLESDHRPLVLFIDACPAKRKFLFHFEAKWLQHPQCAEVIQRVWNNSSCGSAIFFFHA